MRANQQITQIIAHIKTKSKISHRCGKYCKIGGKAFYRKHLMMARYVMQQVRKTNREEVEG